MRTNVRNPYWMYNIYVFYSLCCVKMCIGLSVWWLCSCVCAVCVSRLVSDKHLLLSAFLLQYIGFERNNIATYSSDKIAASTTVGGPSLLVHSLLLESSHMSPMLLLSRSVVCVCVCVCACVAHSHTARLYCTACSLGVWLLQTCKLRTSLWYDLIRGTFHSQPKLNYSI